MINITKSRKNVREHVNITVAAILAVMAAALFTAFTAGMLAGMKPMKAKAASDSMTIYAIDLGAANSGEATMVADGSGGSLLIDTGESNSKSLLNWLNDNGYKNKKFDLLITHWHIDHVGYAEKLMNEYSVGTVYLPDSSRLTQQSDINLFNRIRNAANKSGTSIVYLKKGMTIRVGKNVSGEVLYVNGSPASENEDVDRMINNESAVVLFKGGGSSFLAAGDLMREGEQRLLSSGADIRADIYKLSHHGYPESNIREFVKTVDPCYAWFTTNDAGPSYFAPPSVSDAVRRMSSTCNMFSTRYNGTIRFACSGGKITVKADRNVNMMYRKLRDLKTGSETRGKFIFNNKGVPRLRAKILDAATYDSTQIQSNGKLFAGSWKKENGHWRLVDEKGMYAVDTTAKCNGKYVLIDENGTRYDKGWKTLDGKRRYFDPYMATGFKRINGRTYYFIDRNYNKYTVDDEGKMFTGFVTIKGRRYYLIDKKCKTYKDYLRGVMATGWNTIDGRKFYMSERGVIRKGFQEIGGETYYFSNYGIMVTGKQTIGGREYSFDEFGRMR